MRLGWARSQSNDATGAESGGGSGRAAALPVGVSVETGSGLGAGHKRAAEGGAYPSMSRARLGNNTDGK